MTGYCESCDSTTKDTRFIEDDLQDLCKDCYMYRLENNLADYPDRRHWEDYPESQFDNISEVYGI